MKWYPEGKSGWKRSILRLAAFLISLWLLAVYCFDVWMPGRSYSGPAPAETETQVSLRNRLQRHVSVLATDIGERNTNMRAGLEKAALYIEEQFKGAGYTPAAQVFKAHMQDVRNIEVELPGASRPEEIFIVGAHYDTCVGGPGANDNGTGTAAVIELARLFRDASPGCTIRFVAFVNEEPPHFQTKTMGSWVYASRCKQHKENVVGMLSIETIGCFLDEPGSQQYPFPFNLAYPDTGNFLGFVSDTGSASFMKECVRVFREKATLPSEGASGPDMIQGIGWSDHWSFYKNGYPAAMVTDTAVFRYEHYHTAQDTPDKIDYARFTLAVEGLRAMIEELVRR